MFDTHCHLQDERLAHDIAGVLERAKAAGITRFLCCGSEEADWEPVRRICAEHPAVKPSFGLHPRYIANRSPGWLTSLRALLAATNAAVGEIGLDFAFEPRDDKMQEEIFRLQLVVAAELNRPVSIHCRQAWGRMLEILRTTPRRPPALVFHSYSGSRDMLELLAELGGHFAFGGILTRHNNRRGHEAAKAVPPDRLLVETDAPDLMPLPPADGSYPVPHGPVNEPANLVCVIRELARLRGESVASIAALTDANARRIFGD